VPSQRIKGQETTVIIARDTNIETELTDIQNFNLVFVNEILFQRYLGETSDRTDDVHKHVKGDMEMHLHSQDFLVFLQAAIDRMKRITPDLVFNVSSVLNFPNGQTPTILVPDIKMGEFPMNVPGGTDYIKFKLDFAADSHDIQF
jgi:hypothetical protein